MHTYYTELRFNLQLEFLLFQLKLVKFNSKLNISQNIFYCHEICNIFARNNLSLLYRFGKKKYKIKNYVFYTAKEQHKTLQ